MSEKCLAVDSDAAIADSYTTAWARHNISMDRADTMTDAIKKLLFCENYIFVGINGDAVNFMPLLSTMRSVTGTPILVVTSRFTTKAEVAALDSGADLFTLWHQSVEDNIASVLAHVAYAARQPIRKVNPRKVMVYKDLLVASFRYQRGVFVGNSKIDLTRREFDILYYLMANHGKALTYNQIYKRIWGQEYADTSRDVLRNAVKRLREKLRIDPDGTEYIETVRDVGYCFPLESDK